MGIVRASHRRKIRMCVGMPLQHISRRTTENRALMPRWPARASPPFAGKPACMEPPHMELSETAIEEKIRMCVGMPLQHISRRITQNRSLNAPMAGADGIARFPLARANVSGARHAEAPTGGKPSKRGPVLQRAEAPPPHRPMQGRPAALLLPRAAFLPQFGPRRRRPRSGGNPRLTRAWRIRIMSIAFRGVQRVLRASRFAPGTSVG